MGRLDQELLHRGLARSRTHAATLISQGRVSSGGTVLAKASARVGEGQELTVDHGSDADYVSRAGHKLAGALDTFAAIEVRDRRCLDAGASTGGFTDVLLRRGAREVVAVDVGHGQLVDQLRGDARVHVHEGLNIRYLDPDMIGGPAQLTVCDLSFISLTLVMAPLAAATDDGGDLLLMVKPQFEVGRERLSRTGVVSSGHERRRAVAAVASAAVAQGLQPRGLAVSPLPGQYGNVEYFLWLQRRDQTGAGEQRTVMLEEEQTGSSDPVAMLLESVWPGTAGGS